MAENNWNHHKNKNFVKVKEKLNKVGCGMCLAKWTQVTIQMQTGHTHSCPHPKTHKIPVSELKRNPSALHNTRFKKRRRREMLEGKRPAECDYCWNVEDNSNQFSDRIFKSNESWSMIDPYYGIYFLNEDNKFSKYPIIVMGRENFNLGSLFIDRDEILGNKWVYYASYLEILFENNIIKNKKEFIAKYKNIDEFCCLLVVFENNSKIIYIPYPED